MRNFYQYPTLPYIGQYFYKPIRLGGLAGVCTPLLFQWISYGASTQVPNIVVPIDFSSSAIASKMGSPRSVYIDNTGSDVPIYVFFPDSGQTIVCQPNATLWAPCYTGQMQVLIAALGFVTGDIPTTYIMFTNLPVSPALDLELATAISLNKASANITRGNTIYNSNYGVPALGDQTVSYQNAATPSGPQILQTGIWNTPQASGFIYLTHMFISGYLASGTPSNYAWVIESTGISGVLYSFNVDFFSGIYTPVITLNGMQIKLDATQTWRIRVSASGSGVTFNHIFNWTQNPL